ncbi:helix-turn-helix domain-containing protein, partial [Stenotrophomonas maltophilia group sp. CASM10]|uniref:helix-turn-helix domain-containing protein n=1 Tax=Stenotrophomonas maltophilia group sp. CASM10 TaxID=3111513 RepID=UPI003BF8C63D
MWASCIEHQLCPFGSKAQRAGATDASTGTGDEGDLVVQAHEGGTGCGVATTMPRLSPADTPFPGLPTRCRKRSFRRTGTCQNPSMDSTATTAPDARVERVCRHLQASLDEPSLQALAAIAGCSPTRLHRLFKQATGLTPKQYAAALRADRLRSELQQKERITDAFHDAGFGSSGRFYE